MHEYIRSFLLTETMTLVAAETEKLQNKKKDTDCGGGDTEQQCNADSLDKHKANSAIHSISQTNGRSEHFNKDALEDSTPHSGDLFTSGHNKTLQISLQSNNTETLEYVTDFEILPKI